MHSEDGGALMIVSGELPETAKLPAEVKLSAPAGSTVQWAGEILGGDVSADPSVKYDVATEGDTDVYSFTLAQSRIGQIEVLASEAATQTLTGGTADFGWTAPATTKKLVLNLRVPQGAKLTGPANGITSTPGPTGYAYLQREVNDVKPGQTEVLKVAYTAPAAPPAGGVTQPTPAAETSPVLYVVLAAVAGLFALFGMAVWRKMSGATSSDGDRQPRVTTASASSKPRASAGTTVATDEAPDARAGRGAIQPKTVAVVLVVGALVVGGAFAVSSGGSATTVGDVVTMQYAQVDACTVTNLVLTPPAGADLAKDAEKIMSTLRSVPGVGSSTVHLKEQRLQVDYCESSASEEQLVAAVEGTGYKVGSVTTGPAQ